MHVLILDTEAAEILLDAADTAARFLRYRAKRIDPDGIVSGAATLQENKLLQVRAQLAAPPIDQFEDLHPRQRDHVINAARILAEAKDPAHRQTAFRLLQATILKPQPVEAIKPEPLTDEE